MRSRTRHAPLLPAVLGAALAAVLTCAPSALAQDDVPRPKVGLALGGGSARGLAHLGVLRWLDEHRVPVDVIGGTSMGGLLAGSLATGMTPAEIDALIDGLDWARVLSPDSPFGDKTFRRKEDAREFPSLLEFGLKGGFKLPGGLSPAEQVNLLFDRIALPYYGLDRFRDLPIPFACVAVDLRTSDTVVLDAGRLQDALRATMAIPGVFTPVRRGNQVLVDGGVLNNVPADIVKDMGADVVVAVDVGADLSQPKTSDTIFAVLGETLDVMMRAAARRALAAANIVIEPDLKGLSSTDFSRAVEFARRGYAAADANRERLLRLALSEADYRAHLAARQARRRTAVPVPAFLTIEGVTGAQASVVRRRMARHVGRPIDTHAIDRDLTLLTGSDRYDTLTYRIEVLNGTPGLVVTAGLKAHAPPYLLLALDLQNSESSSVDASLRSRVTLFDVITPGSELRLDLGIGRTTRAGAELALSMGRGFFVAPRASYNRDTVNVFVDQQIASEYQRTIRDFGADVGFTSGRSLEARLGYAYQRVDASVRVGAPTVPQVTGAQGFWRSQVVFDNQDNPVVPARGLYARAQLRKFTATARVGLPEPYGANPEPDDLLSGDATGSMFVPAWGKGRFFVAAAGGSSFGDTTVVNAFTLGGPLALSALQTDELRGSNFVLGHAGYFHEVARIFEGAAGRLYLGAWVENGATFERLAQAQIRTNLSGGLIMETLLGPTFLVGSVGNDGRHRIYIGLGPVFRQ